ncbi:MAG: AarF/ABC1/UbiB kinase family protein [Chloroflexi bacterium]|nr:AarF/ABC1/UbiB kinase family protein [Chloroflexota bacterium]
MNGSMNALQRAHRSLSLGWLAASIFAGYRWHGWRTRRLPPDETQRRLSALHRRNAERIYDTAARLKGLLIKVGQLVGARADIFPDEYIEVLSRLHDTLPPRPYAVIRHVIESELGASIDDIFAELNQTAIAAASLAQVHRGRLHDGRDVAVKVQYPEIEAIVRVDLQNMRLLARVAGRLLRDFDFTSIVDELSENAPLELDFIHEGHNAETSAENFAGQEDIIIPRIYWEHTTRRVLVMEFVDGIKITDVAALKAAEIDINAVVHLVTESYLRQIFAHGFFHADPHPGNLFVQPGPKLVIVDYGLAKQLQPGFLQGFIRLMTALIAADQSGLAQAFRDLGFHTRHEDDAVFEALGESMITRLSRSAEFNQNRQLLFEFQERMMRIFRENPVVRIPGEFLYIGRVLGLLSGLGAQLGAEIDLMEVLGEQVPSPAASTQ